VSAGPTASGVSLWLMPEGEAGERLARCIERLASRLGTPSFPPHVTLLPGLRGPVEPVLTAVSELARDVRPFAVRLSGVEGGDEPFRCLYARAHGSAPLLEAHARAVRRLLPTIEAPFGPHLSLVYGALDPVTKADLSRELDAETRLSFAVRRIHAWRTEGDVSAWGEIGSFGLVGSISTPGGRAGG